MREYLSGDTRQRQRAYSPAVKVSGGTTIYLAGHAGYQDDLGETYPGNFDGQVRVAFERLRQTLEKAGGKLRCWSGARFPSSKMTWLNLKCGLKT